MTLSFIFPAVLWGLLVLPLLWLLAWLTRTMNSARLGRIRYGLLLLVRSIILASLVLALAGTQFVRAVNDTAVVFLIDGSDSLAPALRTRALTYVNEAMASADAGDQAAVIVFGGSPAVERAPAPATPLQRLSSVVMGSRTNIADAIQLGLALLPADMQKRIVLLSDGGENEGRAAEAARLAVLRNIPIEVMSLTGVIGADVLITALVTPSTAREGQEIPALLRIQSTITGPAQISLLTDGQLIARQDVEITAGVHEVRLNVPAGMAGFRRFEARIEAPADTQPVNNRAAAFTQVLGPPHILLVASEADRAVSLNNALTAAGMRVDLIIPSQLSADQARLHDYAAVVLIDVPAVLVPTVAQEALISYVRNQGGGLAMIGGTESFGAGGWRRTPIADVLPVALDLPALADRPDLGLALVIDRSGSMGEAVSGRRTKLDLAKDAVYQATLGLAHSDQIGVFVFDDTAQTALSMQNLPDLATIEATLSHVSEGGGTDIRAGIALAAQEIAATQARIRHVILLTDGQASDNYADLIEQMHAAGVTITTVAIGSDANPNLELIAQQGGGAFYNVGSAADLPQIFLAETVRVAQRDLVEEIFTPASALPAPLVRDLGGLPKLYGYNASTPRDTARTFFVAPDGAPILAVWQYGLGRSLAWTSDLKGQWGRDLVAWERFPHLAAGMINMLFTPATSNILDLAMRNDGSQAIFDLSASDAAGVPLSIPQIESRLLDPTGKSSSLSFTQVGPGRYRAVVPAEQSGVYLAQVIGLDAQDQPLGSASGGLVVSYSPEYGLHSTNAGLLSDIAALTGGHVDPAPSNIFTPSAQHVGQVHEISLLLLWLALCLLPFDIGLRRLFLRRDAFAFPAFRRSAGSPATTEDSTMARLQAARSRARRASVSGAHAPVEQPSSPSPPPPSPTHELPVAPAAPAPTEDSVSNLLSAKRRRQR